MSGALAIFVKTPGHSAVKSRLAQARGERFAVEWYQRAAAAVASIAKVAQACSGVAAYWAVAESDALDAWPDLPVIAQGQGGLGERMARVHAQLVAQHGCGLLLGADAPQLTAVLLGRAFEWLATAESRLVLGPARDGGFWLFGGNVAPARELWAAVTYSAPDTARDLQRSMESVGNWLTLESLTDVDHDRDLTPVLESLQALAHATPEQRVLAQWMQEQQERLP